MKKIKIGTLLGISVASIITITSLLIIGIFFFINQKSIDTLVDNIIIQITQSIQKETKEYMFISKKVNLLLHDLFKKNILNENSPISSKIQNKKNIENTKKILSYYNQNKLIPLFNSKKAYIQFFQRKVYQFSNIIEFLKVTISNYPEINIIRYVNLKNEWIELKRMSDMSLSIRYLIPFKNHFLLFWNHTNSNYYYYNSSFKLSNQILTKDLLYKQKPHFWFLNALKKFQISNQNTSNRLKQEFFWDIPDIINFNNDIAFSNSTILTNSKDQKIGIIGTSMHIMNILYQHILKMKFNENTHLFILNKNEQLLLYSPELLSQDIHLVSFFNRQKIENQLKNLINFTPNKNNSLKMKDMLHIQEPLYKKAFHELKAALNLNHEKISTISQFKFNFDYQENPYLGVLSAFPSNDDLNWIVGILFPKQEFYNEINMNIIVIAFISLCIVMVGFFIALNLSSKISSSLKILSKRTTSIGKFQIKKQDAYYQLPSSIHEFQQLNTAFNNMILSLRSFKKYVPAEIVRVLLENSKEAILEGKQEILTIYFSDIADFTNISENLSPQALVSFLSEYLEKMTSEIQKNQGTLDKYIGDAVMAFWGAPKNIINHAYLASLSAINNMRHLKLLNQSEKFRKKNIQFATRIGIHTGEVIVGNIGSKSRINYTVMGDSVNLASRLEGLNKFYNTQIICSETTYKQINHEITTRKLDYVAVKGKILGHFIYEIIELREFTPTNLLYFISIYENAFELYLKQEFQKAYIIFEAALQEKPNDKPSLIMLERIRNYVKNPPPKNWNGVFSFTSK